MLLNNLNKCLKYAFLGIIISVCNAYGQEVDVKNIAHNEEFFDALAGIKFNRDTNLANQTALDLSQELGDGDIVNQLRYNELLFDKFNFLKNVEDAFNGKSFDDVKKEISADLNKRFEQKQSCDAKELISEREYHCEFATCMSNYFFNFHVAYNKKDIKDPIQSLIDDIKEDLAEDDVQSTKNAAVEPEFPRELRTNHIATSQQEQPTGDEIREAKVENGKIPQQPWYQAWKPTLISGAVTVLFLAIMLKPRLCSWLTN